MPATRFRASHLVASAALLALSASTTFAAEINAENLYQQRCAGCHENAATRAPSRVSLGQMPAMTIAQAMFGGAMQQQASGLTQNEIVTLAYFLGGKDRSAQAAEIPPPPACRAPAPPIELAAGQWNGWSPDLENTRFQPTPGLTAADVPRLKVKWAYGYTGRMAYGQPTFIGDRLFVTNTTGEISALDAQSGCAYWTIKAPNGVRSALNVAQMPPGAPAKFIAWFGDGKALAHAIDAQTGKMLWTSKLDEHPYAYVTGATRYYDGKLFVPISSAEEVPGRESKYECCKFRGALVALDAATGKLIWKAHAIQQEPKPFRKNSAGTQQFGPAGGAMWASPTIDARRKLVYATTGNSYTDVDTDGADAVAAFDIATGERRWATQLWAHDNYLVGCNEQNAGQINCPQDAGPDHDFGASAVLKTLADGRQILLVAHKGGIAYGLDPDRRGKVLWERRVGTGSSLGGVEWGIAADDDNVYVAISDLVAKVNPQPGISALKIATGEKVWHVPTPQVQCANGTRCARAQSAAVTAMPGAVFSGAIDGHLRAYDSSSGEILWDFNTAAEFDTVNGVKAKGGSIDAGGTVIANGMVLVNSGYGTWGMPGRVLLVMTVDGK